MGAAKPSKTPLHLRLTCEDWLETFKNLNRAELGVLYYIRCLDPYGDRELILDSTEVSEKLGLHRTSVSRALKVLIQKGLLTEKYLADNKLSIEREVRNKLQAQLGGLAEVVTPVGRVDLLTDAEVIEVKHVKDWKAAMGQILAYSAYFPTHQKRLHLFYGKNKPLADSWEVNRICSELGIVVTTEEVEVDNA